jgi:hypothetical protein
MINHEIVKHNDKLYFVFRKYKASHIKQDKILELMKLLECDIVLKKNEQESILFYLKEIVDLDVLN